MKINKKLNSLKKSMKSNNKLVVGLISISMLILILFAGPVQAFILGLALDNNSPTKGEIITFTAKLDIETMDKYLPIKNLTLLLEGPTNKECVFDIYGNNLTDCDGLNIIPINIDLNGKYGQGEGYGNDSSYGYGYNFGYDCGYGYGYGAGGKEIHLIYNITLDTTNYNPGDYQSSLKSFIGNKTFESKDKPLFTVTDSTSIILGGSSGSRRFYSCGNEFCDVGETIENCPSDCSENNNLFDELSFKDNGEGLILNKTEEPFEKPIFSKITGAVVGTLGKAESWIAIIFILLIFGGLGLIKLRKIKLK
jgi:hypothetical protein